jgi:hypothetical protein
LASLASVCPSVKWSTQLPPQRSCEDQVGRGSRTGQLSSRLLPPSPCPPLPAAASLSWTKACPPLAHCLGSSIPRLQGSLPQPPNPAPLAPGWHWPSKAWGCPDSWWHSCCLLDSGGRCCPRLEPAGTGSSGPVVPQPWVPRGVSRSFSLESHKSKSGLRPRGPGSPASTVVVMSPCCCVTLAK